MCVCVCVCVCVTVSRRGLTQKRLPSTAAFSSAVVLFFHRRHQPEGNDAGGPLLSGREGRPGKITKTQEGSFWL